MQSTQKQNSVMTTRLDGTRIVWEIREPMIEDKPGALIGSAAFDMSKAHSGLQDRARVHGWVQRISDAAALSRKIVNGKEVNATPENKLAAIRRMIEHYESGSMDWSPRRAQVIGSDETMLARVLQHLLDNQPERLPNAGQGLTVERIRAFTAERSSAERKAILRKYQDVVDLMTESETKDIDTEALLEGL
jgi:hypothetical protein